MGTLTDAITQAGQPDSREQAIIDRHKEKARKGSLFQDIAEGMAEIEIDTRRQQRAYAEKPTTEIGQIMAAPVKDMISNLGDRAKVLSTIRSLSPEQRQEALKLAPGIAQQLGDDRGGAVGRTLGALSRGVSHGVSQPLMELAGAGGTPEEIAYIRQLDAAASQEFNPARPGDPWYQSGPLQAAEMMPWMATVVGGGGAGRSAATAIAQRVTAGAAAGSKVAGAVNAVGQAVGKLPGAAAAKVGLKGVPAVTAGKVGELAGITAAAFPGQYAQEVDSLKALGMVDDTKLRLLAGGTAAITGLVEGLVPNPFKAGQVSLTEGATKAARQYLWNAAKNAPGELTEEYLQGVTSGLGEHVAQYIGTEVEGKNPAKKKTIEDAFRKGWEQSKESALPMAFLLGVPAVGGAGMAAARAMQGTSVDGIPIEGTMPTEAVPPALPGQTETRDTVSPNQAPPQLPPVQPPQPPVQPPALPQTQQAPTDPLLAGMSPEAVQKLGELESPPGAHKYADVVHGDRRQFKKAPEEALRIQQWEKAREVVTGVATQAIQEQAVADQSTEEAKYAEEVARRRAAKSGVKPPALPEQQTQQPPALPTEPVRDTVSQDQPVEKDAVGERTKIADTPVVRSASFTDDNNIRYELFESEDGKSGVTRAMDMDSGNVIEIKKYPDVDSAKNAFSKTQGSQPEVRDTVSQPEQPKIKGPKPVEQAATEATVTTSEPPRNWKRDDRVFVSGSTVSGDKLPNSVGKVVKVNDDNVVVQLDGEGASKYRAVSKDKLQLPDARFEVGEKVGVPWSAEKTGTVSKVLPDGTYRVIVTGREMGQTADQMVKLDKPKPELSPIGDSTPKTESTSIPMPTTLEELEALPKYSIYQRKVGSEGKIRYQVRGDGKRGGGDSLHDTIEQAQEEAALVKQRDTDRQAAQDKQKADEEAAAKKQVEYESSFGGFLSSDAMNKGRQLKVLGANRSYNGKVTTVKDIVEQKVAGGAVVNDRGQLESPDGAYLGSDKITKIGIDYAKHLIEAKSRDTVSLEPKRDQENKDAPKPKEGGDPNEVQAKDGQRQANAETKAEAKGQVGDKGGQAAGETPSSDSSVTDGFRALPKAGQEAFETEWKKGTSSIKNILYPNNKNYRAEFEARTGIKLPKTAGGTFEAVEKWHKEGRKLAGEKSLSDSSVDGKPKPPKGYKPLKEFTPSVTQTLSPDLELQENRDGIKELGLKQGEAVGYRVYPKRGSSKGGYWKYGIVRYEPSGSHASIELEDGTTESVGGSRLHRLEPETKLSEWEQGVADLLATVPAFKGASFEMSKDQNTIKVTRPDGKTTTINFNADEQLDKLAEKNGMAFVYGAYNYKTGSKSDGHIFLRSSGDPETLNHEVVHWLEDEGIITAEEVEKYGGREGLAEAYGVWAAKQSRPSNTLFEKIYDFLESIFDVNVKFFKELTDRVDATETDMHYPDGSAYRNWMNRKHRIGDTPTSYLSGHSSAGVRNVAKENPGLGLVITPANPGYVGHGGDYSHVMIDNGAFSEFTGTAPFNEDKFFALLDKVVAAGLKDKVQHVVVPDKVGDWKGTTERWKQFYERVKAYGMPLAYVGQDGIEEHTDQIPWDQFDVFFIGGSTPWKLGYDPKGEYKDFNRPTDAELAKAGYLKAQGDLIKEAKRRGKRVHMGRVNSWKRMEVANYGAQVDSVDGNYIGAAPDKNLPVVIDWLKITGGEQFKANETPKVGDVIERDGKRGVVTKLKKDGDLAVDYEETSASGRKVSPRYSGFGLVRPGQYVTVGQSPFPVTLDQFYKEFGNKSQEQVTKEAIELWNSLDDNDKSRFAHRLRRFGIAGAKKNSKPETLAASIANVISLSAGVPGKLREVYDIAMEYPQINSIFDDPEQARLHTEMMQRIDETGLTLPPMQRAALVFPDMRKELLHDLARQQFGQEIADALFEDVQAPVEPPVVDTTAIPEDGMSLDEFADIFANPEKTAEAPVKNRGTKKPNGDKAESKPRSVKKGRSKGVEEGLDEAKAGADLILKGLKDLGVTGFSGPPINADMARGLGMLANGLIKAGKYKFAEFIDSAIELLGAPAVRYLGPYLEAGWNKKSETDNRLDKAGSVTELLSREDYGTAESPNRVALGKHFANKFRSGGSYARITEARKEASELIGEPLKDGSQAIKDIDEAIEIGVVINAREIAQSEDSDEGIYDRLVDLYERQPNLGTRTSTSIKDQAYSTPAPLAFLVNRQAGIGEDDIVYDSSAGNGMLLIVGGKRIANEINLKRAEALRAMDIPTTTEDASEFKQMKPFTAVAINPPFNNDTDEDGNKKQWIVDGVKVGKIDHAITLRTLNDMPDDGKVAIVIAAKGFEQRKPKPDKERSKAYLKGGKTFYDAIYDNYNVTDHYSVHGDLYARQGAAFPVDVIIIDGRGKSSRPKPYNIVEGGIPKVFDSWEGLKDAKLLGNIRSTESGAERGAIEPRQEGVPKETAGDTRQGSDGVRAGARGTDKQDGRSIQGPRESEDLGGRNQDAVVSGQTEQAMGSDKQSASKPRGSKQQPRASDGRNDSRIPGGAKNRDAGVDKLDSEESEVKGDQYQSVYTPSSKSKSVDALIPNNHQTAVQAALDSVEEQYGDIDEFVAKELGVNQTRLHKVFSAEQVDALALAIARHKDGRAFILGDQTGVGKGRVAAGMLIYAKNQGLAPVFFTEKPTLYADIIRDLIDTGFSTDDAPFSPLITNVTAKKSDQIELPDGRVLKQTAGADESNIEEAVGSFLAGKGLVATSKKATKKKAAQTKTYDAIFTTYNQMVTINGELKPRHTFLKQLSPRAFFVLDESHNAGGSAQDSDKDKPQKAEDNKIPVSEMVRDLIENSSGVYFSSGTYAKRPSVMDLYAKTGMTAATGQDGDSLASSIAAGGVPLQQIVSQQLVESGAYLRRERSFDGVEFKPQVYDVSTEGAEQSAAIFRAINAFDKIKGRLVEEDIEDGVTSAGGSIKPDWATGEAGMTSTNFSSILWNLTDQMLLAVKADVIADEAIASIERGESPVIYVDATMEAALNAYIESSGLQVGEKSEFSFRDLLQRYLDRSREVLVQRDVSDKNSYEQVRLTDEQLGEVGLAAFNKAQDLIDDFSADLPASPIDWIRKRIEDEGYTFGEYTGRQMVMRYQNANTATVEKRPEDEVGAANRINLIRRFNNGDLDVLLFNRSGSTGISMHASEKVKNQKPRHMIIGQPSSNIDTFMQSLGRIHRTGQVTLPKFTLAMTSLPSEIRPSSVLVKKLASLNANVTASDKGSVSFDVPDVMNVIGDRIVAEYLAENDELNRALNEGEDEGLVVVGRTGQPRIVPGIARKASGRLAIMPIKVQQEFWDSVTDTFADTIEELDRMGSNPLSARVADLDAKTVESFPVFEGDTESANVFDRPAYIEKVVAKRPGKPMTPDEIMQKVTSFYKLESGSKDLQAVMNTWEMNRRDEALASTAKRIEEIRNEGLEKGTDPERIKNSIDRENQQKQNFLYLVRAFTPGTSVSVWESGPSDGLDVIPGVVLSIERKGKGGNPISLSKWRVEIAIGSPDRIIRMSLSQLRVASDQNDNSSRNEQDENAEDNLKVFTNREMVNASVLKDFVESEVSTMETRYIGTGNILAAFNLFREQKGRVTFFRDSDGNLQRGVLLPRRFKIDKWINDQPVGFDRVDQIQRFLASGNNLQTPDRALSVMSVRGGLVLRAPKSKARGGKYTLSKVLLDASSPQEFVSIGSRMEMVIDDAGKQTDVINAILSISGLQATTDKELARSIKSEVVSKESIGLAKKITGLPETLYQTDDIDPSVRVQALDIAFAAEDAGIDTFDKLVAYSVKTVGERRTREIGGYLKLAANAAGFKGVRTVGDVLGSPNVTKEQATEFAKAAFPMLSDVQIKTGIAILDRLGLLDKVGFSPAGSPVPDSGQKSGNVRGWTSFISATRALIGATDTANISTFIHEIAHPMRRFLLSRDVPQDKRFDITDAELSKLEDALGVKDGAWEVENEEKFAKMWEQYWFDGKAPSKGLESLFEKIARWMQNIYKSIQQITGVQLPSEVRSLFDKLMLQSGNEEVRDTVSRELEETTSIKNEKANARRARDGIPPLADVASETQDKWLDMADELLQDDPMLGDSLVKEINTKARNLSNVEVAVMQIHYRAMNNRLEKASDRLFAAKDAKDAAESAKALMDVDIVMNALAEIEEATKAAGREWGRAGVARQIELNKDFSRAAILRKARIANGGNALSEKQIEEMDALAKRVAQLEGDLAKAVQDKLDIERKRNAEDQIEDSKSKVRPIPESIRSKAVGKLNKLAARFGLVSKTDTLFATEDQQTADEAAAVVQAYVDMGVFSLGEFLANIRKDLGTDIPVSMQASLSTAWNDLKGSGDIPTPMVDKNDVRGLSRLAKQIERALVESGITKLEDVVRGVRESLQEIIPEITERETMDAMSGYGQYSPPSEDMYDKIIADINGRLLELAKLNDMEQGIAPARTGVGRQEKSDEHRELIRKVNLAKRDPKYQLTDPDFQLKTAVGSALTALRNRIYDLNNSINVTKQPIVSGSKEDVAGQDARVVKLRKERDELMAIYKTMFPKPGATMEQRIAATDRALDRVIADLVKQLETENFTTSKKAEPISTKELDAKRAQIDALRAQREAIVGVRKQTDEQKSKAYKAILLKQIADYKDRSLHSYFGPKPKKEVRTLSKEEIALKLELQKAKDDFFKLAGLYRLENMSPKERAWDYVKETAHLSRALMTSFDFSAVFRQGGTIAFAHPMMAAETSMEMYNAMASEAATFEFAENIRKDDMYQFAMTAGLSITEEEGKITKQEEAYMGRWAKLGFGSPGSTINTISKGFLFPVAASARGYMTFLNGLRFKLFKQMVANLGKGGQVTADEAKVIAMYINAATGRSELGPMMKWAEQANMLFFAPRFVASRFQYLGMPLWLLGSSKVSGRVKKAIAMEYIRHSSSVGLFLGLTVALGSLLGDDDDEKPTVNLDPRSSDFLKIKLGETRIDPMSGLSQVITLVSRIGSGQRTGADGEAVDMRGEDAPQFALGVAGTIGNFVRTKLAPIPGAALDIANDGKNVVGQDVTPFQSLVNLFVPLSIREIKDTVDSRGIPQGALIALISLHGMGASTYGPESNYRKGTEEQNKKQFDKTLKKMTFDSPDPVYKELLNKEQLEKVDERREERKQGLVFAASSDPIRKLFKNDETYNQAVKERDTALESLKKAGWSLEESRKLLIDHWEANYGSAREVRKGVRVYKEALSDRLKKLRKVFSE